MTNAVAERLASRVFVFVPAFAGMTGQIADQSPIVSDFGFLFLDSATTRRMTGNSRFAQNDANAEFSQESARSVIAI
jgi:hypothetical protein